MLSARFTAMQDQIDALTAAVEDLTATVAALRAQVAAAGGPGGPGEVR